MKQRGIAGFLLCLASLASVAQDAPPQPESRTLYNREHIELDAQGLTITTLEQAELLLTEKAAREQNFRTFTVKPTLASFEVLEAYVQKPDGSRQSVAADRIQRQRGQVSGVSGASFDDTEQVIVLFPGPQAGDRVVTRVRWRMVKTPFPGHFWNWRAMGYQWSVDDYEYSVNYPASFPLRVITRDAEVPQRMEKDGRIHLTWRQRDLRWHPPESRAVHVSQFGARWFLSSYPSEEALAAQEAARWMGKQELTPAIRAQAAQLSAGANTPGEKAQRIYDWVRSQIRYQAVALDSGGWVPEPAARVLEERVGDCKGHTALLTALLHAADIQAVPVLIDTWGPRRGFELPMPDYNHMISYLPELNLFLDSTVRQAPYGVLPDEIHDRPVLLLGDLQRPARTPVEDEQQDRIHSEVRYELSASGTLRGEQTIRAFGGEGIELRRWYDSLSEYQRQRLVSNLLTGQGYSGSGNLQELSEADPRVYGLRLDFTAPDYFSPDTAFALRTRSLKSVMSLSELRAAFVPEQRLSPYGCGRYSEEEEIRFVFPAAWSVSLPKNVALEAGGLSYQQNYQSRAGEVLAQRKLVSAMPGGICEPSRYAADRALVQAASRASQAQIIWQPSLNAPRKP